MLRGALAILALVLVVPTAAAHFDTRVGDESFALAPGRAREFAFDVHYHRVIGRIDVTGAPVDLALVDGDRWPPASPGAAPEAFWTLEGVSGSRGLNVLVDCCDDAAYSTFVLVVSHGGGEGTSRVSLDAKATHDDVVVGMAGAEGDVVSNALAFWVAAGVVAVRLVHVRAYGASGPRANVARAALVVGGAFVGTLAAGAWGAWRFGGGLVAGAVGAFGAWFPSFGPAAFVLLVAAALTWALVLWARAVKGSREAGEGRALVVAAGVALAVVSFGAPFALVPEYGARVLRFGPIMAAPYVLTVGVGLFFVARDALRRRPRARVEARDAP